MFRAGKPGGWGCGRAIFRGVPNRSMVPWQDHGGTILLPVRPEPATCHSHYCECLCKLAAIRPHVGPAAYFTKPLAEPLDALQALLDVRHIGVRTNAFHFPSL